MMNQIKELTEKSIKINNAELAYELFIDKVDGETMVDVLDSVYKFFKEVENEQN